MTETTTATVIDSQRFREVLGQYPTGVSVVTARQQDGSPVGFAVGSFSSVSLRPALVAFMADVGSSSWPKIEATGSFCVNVLAAEQEYICRAFAAKSSDKFSGLTWRPSGSGSPVLEGAVAWIDCDIEDVHRAGDHHIVIGRVRELDVASPALPLLFFRGGYGSFAPLSSTAVEEDLLGQLRMVDQIRPHMEHIARDLQVECNAAVVVGDEFIYIARSGRSARGEVPTRVGRRLPFRPPVGSAFAAWGAPQCVEAWLDRLGADAGSGERDAWNEVRHRVRARGYSVGLGRHRHTALWSRLTSLPANTGTHDEEMDRIIDSLLAGYEQRDLEPGKSYDVRTIAAPVFGPDGQVVVQLTLYGLPPRCDSEAIEEYARRLRAGAAAASAALKRGGAH